MHIYLGLSTNVGEFFRVKIFRIVKILCADKEINKNTITEEVDELRCDDI